jgi:hypothetical protein
MANNHKPSDSKQAKTFSKYGQIVEDIENWFTPSECQNLLLGILEQFKFDSDALDLIREVVDKDSADIFAEEVVEEEPKPKTFADRIIEFLIEEEKKKNKKG